MASPHREKTFHDLLTSPWTLLPAVAGVSAVIVGWALDQELFFYYLGGAAGLALAAAALVTQWLWSWEAPNPEVEQLRQQLLDGLETFGRTHGRGQAAEAQAGGTSAPLQR